MLDTMVPKKVFLTKGVGVHKDKLASFELALRSAGIEGCNLVYVSSIFPPECKIISKDEGLSKPLNKQGSFQPGKLDDSITPGKKGQQNIVRFVFYHEPVLKLREHQLS